MPQDLGYIPFGILTPAQKERVLSELASIRYNAALEGLGLDRLAGDELALIRETAARNRHLAPSLEDDVKPSVAFRAMKTLYGYVPFARLHEGTRCEIDKALDYDVEQELVEFAEQGYGCDALFDHWNPEVRAAVALRGCFGEELAYDESPAVRTAVVAGGGVSESSPEMETLARDADPAVRLEVARLDTPFNDELCEDVDATVRETAQAMRAQRALKRGEIEYSWLRSDEIPEKVRETLNVGPEDKVEVARKVPERKAATLDPDGKEKEARQQSDGARVPGKAQSRTR